MNIMKTGNTKKFAIFCATKSVKDFAGFQIFIFKTNGEK